MKYKNFDILYMDEKKVVGVESKEDFGRLGNQITLTRFFNLCYSRGE